MKTMKILFLCCSLVLFSCKKETPAPTPTNQNTNPPVMVSTTVSVSFVDIASMNTVPLNTISIQLIEANGTVDTTFSPIAYTSESTYPMTGPCGVTSPIPFTFTKTFPEGSNYRMRLYSGTNRLLDYRIHEVSYYNDTLAPGVSCNACSSNHDFKVLF